MSEYEDFALGDSGDFRNDEALASPCRENEYTWLPPVLEVGDYRIDGFLLIGAELIQSSLGVLAQKP